MPDPGFDPFDSTTVAKLRAGEVARGIASSARDTSVPEPDRDTTFNTGLLLQAGLRAVLSVEQRTGVALPGAPGTKDPPALIAAQRNYAEVFTGGKEATPDQRQVALASVATAARELAAQGYTSLSSKVNSWLQGQGYVPPTSVSPPRPRSAPGMRP